MIFIVLPAYNEEMTIQPLLEAIRENMEESQLPYKVIVVNDGSTDNTLEVVRQASLFGHVMIIEHQKNMGLAEALKTGLLKAVNEARNKDIIVTMDSDNTHMPGLIIRMMRMIREGHDVVIASRYQKGSRIVGVPFFRRVLSFCAGIIFRILFHMKGVKDYTTGYRAYRYEVIKKMFDSYGDNFISQSGFSCMADILLKMRNYPFVIGEVPIVLRYDQKSGTSKMKVVKTISETLGLIVKRYFFKEAL